MPSARRLCWSILRIVLAIAACAALLVGGVFVLSYHLITYTTFSARLGALAVGFVSLLLAWILGRCARVARRRANDLAIAEHAAAIRLGPQPSIAHITLAFVCTRKGDHARAIAHYEAAIRLH